MDRNGMAKEKRDEATRLRGAILRDVYALRPLGQASELSVAMGLQPKRGALVALPFGPVFVFAKGRAPKPADVARWERDEARAKALDAEAVFYQCGFGVIEDNRTVGNRRVLEHGHILDGLGLLTDDERAFLARLDAFWTAHPAAKGGIVDGGDIRPLDY